MESFLVPFIVMLLAWAAFALTCVLAPLWPMRNRSQALMSMLGSLCVAAILATMLPEEMLARWLPESRPASPVETAVAVETEAPPGLQEIAAAEEVGEIPASPEIATPDGSRVAALGQRPDDRTLVVPESEDPPVVIAALPVEDTGTAPAEAAQPAFVLGRTMLAEPAPSSPVKRYGANDLTWFADTLPYQHGILAAVNRILRENRDCRSIDRDSVAHLDAEGSADDPAFYVTCNSGASAFNVSFRLAGGGMDTSRKPTGPIDRESALEACERYARDAAVNPASVEMSRGADLEFVAGHAGEARVTANVLAEAAQGQMAVYRIDCLFHDRTMLEATIIDTAK